MPARDIGVRTQAAFQVILADLGEQRIVGIARRRQGFGGQMRRQVQQRASRGQDKEPVAGLLDVRDHVGREQDGHAVGPHGPDQDVEELASAQVVEAHSSVTYHVYMLGFLPGMAYLGDLPAALVLPRLLTPRLKVPAGSLAIATTMTCIIPLETPSGWHLIGRSPISLLRWRPHPEALLAAGDKVNFAPVSLDEYEQLSAQSASGKLNIMPVGEMTEGAP